MNRAFPFSMVLTVSCSSNSSTEPTGKQGIGQQGGSSSGGGIGGTSALQDSGPSLGSGGAPQKSDAAARESSDAGIRESGSNDGRTGESDSNDATGNASLACGTFADTLCARIQVCASFALAAAFGDVDTCRRRIDLSCNSALLAPQTSSSPASVAACAQWLLALSCDAISTGDLGTACRAAPGGLALGGACGDDAQCASTFARAHLTRCVRNLCRADPSV